MSRADFIALVRGSLVALVVFLFGKVDTMLITLCTFVVLDYISGVISGYILSELSSKVGFKGICKKVYLFILLAIAVKVDMILNANGAIRYTAICIMIGNEGVSIIENSAKCGIPGTEFLYNKLTQLRDMGKKEDNNKEEK